MPAPLLVFATGNESRGDDALGPLLLRQLRVGNFPHVEFLEDYQLQVEHVTDLAGRQAIYFIDADVSCDAPFQFSKITATHDHSYTSHAMSPQALLLAYRQFHGTAAPRSHLLRIRGNQFELGAPLSEQAQRHLAHAVQFMRHQLSEPLK